MKKSKTTLLREAIKISIELKDQYSCSQFMAMYILLLAQFQPLFMILRNNNALESRLFKLIIRPELELLQFLQIGEEYQYIPILIGVAIHKILLFFLLYLAYKKYNFSDYLVIELIKSYINLYQSLLFTVLIIPLSYICINSINGNIINTIFSLTTLIMLQFDVFVYFCICEDCLSYKLKYLDRISVNIYEYVIYLLKITQIVVLVTNSNSEQDIQYILLMIISIAEILNQFVNQNYVFNFQIWIIYFSNILILLFSLFYYIESYNKQQYFGITYTFLFYPLISDLIIKEDKRYQNNCFIGLFNNNDNQQKLYTLFHQLIKIANKCDIEDKYIAMRSSLISYIHSLDCQNQDCICKFTYNLMEVHHANPISQKMENQFFHLKFEQISKLAQLQQDPSDYYYKFALLLYSYGYIMQAVKYFNFLQGQSEANNNEVMKWKTSNSHASQKSIESYSAQNQHRGKKISTELSLIRKIRIEYLKDKSKQIIRMTFGSSLAAAHQSTVAEFLNNYLSNRHAVENAFQFVGLAIQDKIELLLKIHQDKNQHNIRTLFQETKSQLIKIKLKQDHLLQLYKQSPSKQLQNVVCFFYAELQNNYYSANKFYCQNLTTEKVFKFPILGQGTTFAHLFLSVQEDMRHLTIESHSTELYQILDIQDLKRKLSFEQVIPHYIGEEHPFLIERFLVSGKSQFYRNFSSNYIRQANGLVKPISMCFDKSDIMSVDKLIFAAFVQDLNEQQPFLVIDQYNQLGGVSNSLLLELGYDQLMIDSICSKFEFVGIESDKIMPSFAQFLLDGQNSQMNKEINFINLFTLFEQLKYSKIKTSKSMFSQMWKDKRNLIKYFANIVIMKRQVQEFSYYIIEFPSILRIDQYNVEQLSRVLGKNQNYAESSSDHLSDLQINDESDDKIKQIHAIDIKQYSAYATNRLPVQDISSSRVEKSNMLNYQLISKRDSLVQQQEFYNVDQELERSVDQQVEQHAPIEEVMKQDNYEHSAMDSSYLSSNGFRCSQHYKKFELISNLMKSKSPKFLGAIIVFLLTMTFIQFIFCIIILATYNPDLQSIINQNDIISLHASIMGPNDLYLSMKLTIATYKQYLKLKVITDQQYKSLTDPYFNEVNEGYLELQSYFMIQLQNPIIQSYLNDYYVTAYFMKDNITNSYEKKINLKEEIFIILQYAYSSNIIYQKRQDPSQQAFQIFTYANYLNFHSQLETITQEMHSYSRNFSISKGQRWNTMWILFQFIILSLGLINCYYIHQYYKNIDQFMQIIGYIDVFSVVQEIELHRNMLKQIDISNEFVLNYDSGNIQSQILLKSQIREDHKKTEKKYRQTISRVSRLSQILVLFTIYSIFCIYSTVLNQKIQIYLTKYIETANLYKMIQDLKVGSGNIILYKEMLYGIPNYPFLQQSEYDRYLESISNCQVNIKSFIQLTVGIIYSDYLVSDHFISEFKQIQSQNQCDYIAENYHDFMAPYCSLSFEGVLKSGLVPSLTYLVNTVNIEKAINNFTEKAQFNLYEQEGSQIITRIFFYLSDIMKQSLTVITEDNQIFQTIFSIIYLILMILLFSVILKKYQKHIINEYQIIRQVVTLLPLHTMLNDSTLDRYLKQIALNQELQ